MMQIPCKGWFVTCGVAALIATAFVGRPEPARAQFGISIGGFPIGINIHGYRGYRGGRRQRGSRGSRDEAPQSEETRPGKPDKVMTSEGAPTSAQQTKVLQKIASSAIVTDVGSTKDLNEVGQQTLSNDKQRDYTSKNPGHHRCLQGRREKGARRGAPGCARRRDAHADGGRCDHARIEQSLEKAIKNAKLDVFERFVNEAWTSERVRVMILDRVLADLPPLFEGTTAAWRRWRRSTRSFNAPPTEAIGAFSRRRNFLPPIGAPRCSSSGSTRPTALF
jgi:hypothetical protein